MHSPWNPSCRRYDHLFDACFYLVLTAVLFYLHMLMMLLFFIKDQQDVSILNSYR